MNYNILTITGNALDGQPIVSVVLRGLSAEDLDRITLERTETGTRILCGEKIGHSRNKNLSKSDLMVTKTLA